MKVQRLKLIPIPIHLGKCCWWRIVHPLWRKGRRSRWRKGRSCSSRSSTFFASSAKKLSPSQGCWSENNPFWDHKEGCNSSHSFEEVYCSTKFKLFDESGNNLQKICQSKKIRKSHQNLHLLNYIFTIHTVLVKKYF